MRDAGVRVVSFRPLRFRNLWVVQNRAHVRGIVIDLRIGWTGSFGIDDTWLGDGRTKGGWRDTSVRFEGPTVLQLQAAFASAWTEATGALVSGRAAAKQSDEGVHAAGLLATAPTLGSTPAERFLALSIAGAQRTLYSAGVRVYESRARTLRLRMRIRIGGTKLASDTRSAAPFDENPLPLLERQCPTHEANRIPRRAASIRRTSPFATRTTPSSASSRA